MQEILVLIVIALALVYIPKRRGTNRVIRKEVASPPLTGLMRLAILITFLWLAGTALFLKPWDNNLLRYLSTGIAPPFVLWGAAWVFSGYKKYRR